MIQAYRTKNVSLLLEQQFEAIGLSDRQTVLDAGCGVGAPAAYFVGKADIFVEGITISEKQVSTARSRIRQLGLEKKIRITLGDFHQLECYYPENHFDRIYFLESMGHSRDKKRLLTSVMKVLKPGGQVYIKDLFRRVAQDRQFQLRIDSEILRINKCYRYQVTELGSFLDMARELGYVLELARLIDIPLSDFEDLAISNIFQELTGIGQIEDWSAYIFPVDFFEIRLIKAHYDLEKGKDRHFIQNLYRLQIQKWTEKEL